MNSGEKHLKYRIKNKIKKRFIVASIAVMVCLVTAIVVTNMNTHKTEAGVAIGSSNVISIRTSGSGDLDNFGLAYPILYITLDETGVDDWGSDDTITKLLDVVYALYLMQLTII